MRALVSQFDMNTFFKEVDRGRPNQRHTDAYGQIAHFLPIVLARMGLSLRDMDYCVRLVALAARESLNRPVPFPRLLVLFAATKLTAPERYRRFVQGDARGAELINHLNAQQPLWGMGIQTGRYSLAELEAEVYYTDDPELSLQQLKRLENGESSNDLEYVSSELAALDLANEENNGRLQRTIQARVSRSPGMCRARFLARCE